MKATGIDVWDSHTSHADQLLAEEWEIKNRYPKLWEQLRKGGISIGQAANGLVRHYELPANQGYQSGLRAGYGAAWAGRLSDRRATKLASGAEGGSKPIHAPPQGHIRADIPVHGNAHKTSIRSVVAESHCGASYDVVSYWAIKTWPALWVQEDAVSYHI